MAALRGETAAAAAAAGPDLDRPACAAAAQVARDLVGRGFDTATADGRNIVARRGATTWSIANRFTHRPGVRAAVLERFDAAVVRSLVTPTPTESPR